MDDQIIKFLFAIKQNEVNKATDNIIFVSPSITQLIRKSKDKIDIKETIKNLKIK